jgi:hypothetical protein
MLALVGCGKARPAGERGMKAVEAVVSSPFKPRLYVVAVGVSAYRRPDWSLEYGAKDAQDFADFWQRQSGILYESVEPRVLVDAQATRAEILNALEWLQGQVTQHDVAFIFLAGHGNNDSNGRYYFGPHDMEPDRLMASWVPWTDIKATLDATKGKRILFVDTCYAGNVSGQLATRGASDALAQAIDELGRAEDGAVTFGASSARQRARESREMAGGIFTRALLDGLSGNADLDRDQKITVKEVDLFVSRRVKELSNHRQSAVTPKIDRALEDYPIVVLNAPVTLALTPSEKERLEVAKKHLALGTRYGRIHRLSDQDRELGEAYEVFNMLEEKLDEEGRVDLAFTLLMGSASRDAKHAVVLVTGPARTGNPVAENLLGIA